MENKEEFKEYVLEKLKRESHNFFLAESELQSKIMNCSDKRKHRGIREQIVLYREIRYTINGLYRDIEEER